MFPEAESEHISHDHSSMPICFFTSSSFFFNSPVCITTCAKTVTAVMECMELKGAVQDRTQ